MTVCPEPRVTGYVLAGGLSRRMGQDKALLPVGGIPLIQAAIQRLQPVCSGVRILSGPRNPDRDAVLSRYAHLVSDSGNGHIGPLNALLAALQDLPTEYALLLAVDQPAVPGGALFHLAEAAIAASALAAHFLNDGIPEPLPLVVSRKLLRSVERAIGAGQRRLLGTVQACCIDLSRPALAVPAPTSPGNLFLNLNSPDDLERWMNQTSSNQSRPVASEVKNE